MADSKLTGLPDANETDGTEYVYVSQGGTSKRVEVSDLTDASFVRTDNESVQAELSRRAIAYDSRAEFIAATIPAGETYAWIGNVCYVKDPMGTDITSNGGSVKWSIVDIVGLTSEAVFDDATYIDPTQLKFIRAGDTASQTPATVTAGVQAWMQAGMDWVKAGTNRVAVYRGAGQYAINDEIFPETFADDLWSLNNGPDFRFVGPVDMRATGWVAATAVRTSGKYAELSISDPVPKAMFRWEQNAKKTFSPRVSSWRFFGEGKISTDPIGVLMRNINVADFDIFVDKFAQGGLHVSDVNNSEGVWDVAASRNGAQFTNCGDTGFMPDGVFAKTTAGSATVDLVDGTGAAYVGPFAITAAHVGRDVLIDGAGQGGKATVVTIASRVSATQFTIATPATTSRLARRFSFGPLTISTTAGSTAATLPADFKFDLTGRYIGVLKGRSTLHGELDCPFVRVVSHNTTTGAVTLARAVANTVTDAPCITGPNLYIGKDDDQVGADGVTPNSGNNNDFAIKARVEQGVEGYIAVPMVLQNFISAQLIGCKSHGQQPSTLNAGANFTAMVLDNCKHLQAIAQQVEFGGHSQTYGKVVVVGARTYADFVDAHFGDFVTTDNMAMVYTDPQAAGDANCIVELSGGGFTNSDNFPVYDQVKARHGANGASTNVRGALTIRNKEAVLDFDTHEFTPSLEFGGSTTGVTYSSQFGEYTRKGNMVYVRGGFTLTSKGSATGAARVSVGMAPAQFNEQIQAGFVGGVSSMNNPPYLYTRPDGYLYFRMQGAGGGGAVTLTDANFTNSTRVEFNGWYSI